MRKLKVVFLIILESLAIILLFIVQKIQATPYAGAFQKLGASARALGLGGAYVACVADASAIYYNPSAGVLLDSAQLLFLQSRIFAGIVQHNFFSFIMPWSNNQAIGSAILFNRIPDIKITKLPDTNQPPSEYNRPEIERTVNASDWIFYFNYARAMFDNFSLGTNFKIIYRSVGIGSGWGIGLDIGATKILPCNWRLGLHITDATNSALLWNNRTRELITPDLFLGLSKTFQLNNSSILLTSELEGNFDELTFNTNLGSEYLYKNILAFRFGLYHQNFTVGFGLNSKRVFIDYAYVREFYQEGLGSIQKFSGGIRF
ncbi:MAG: PorV/PorQ family protein [candidate division WOR-3 bacterium]